MTLSSGLSVDDLVPQRAPGREALLAVLRRIPGRRMSRILFAITVQAAMIIAAGYLACWLRFDGAIPPRVVKAYIQNIPWLLAIRTLIFVPFGLYGGLWRYTSVWDLSRIVGAVLTSGVAAYLMVYRHAAGLPRSIVIIESVLLILLLGGVRLLPRVVKGSLRPSRGKRVLVLGAGDAGEMIVREMRRGGGYQPIGFIDDDTAKIGRTIHGVTVLGTREDLPRIVTTTRPDEVLVAFPSAGAAAVRSVVKTLEPFKLRITTLPGLKELVNGHVGVKHIRPLAIEDLLPRQPVALDTSVARDLVKGKRVLVTGAGGSIGSELCRQIAALEPARLILLDRYENSLYAIANDLGDRGAGPLVHPTVADVTDAARVEDVFAEHRPHLVFHAAAHKHVPLMEGNPCEAVKNNVLGTQTVAETARRHQAERFVLISTDKAANPSSVMGATKRVAELILQAMSPHSDTRFVTVRFGNVLGSNGSVIPRMVEQIKAGGPVTVTHPDMRRFFMLIPEAVALVLQAAALARNRDTFVLDMGEQIKILSVAENLIRLSGFVPGEDIPITFIGLRPGEKLTEELVGHGEVLEPAEVRSISRVRVQRGGNDTRLQSQVDALIQIAIKGRRHDTLEQLRHIVPTYRPTAVPAVAPAALHWRPAKPRDLRPEAVSTAVSAAKVLHQA